jgi:hypothetical protein
LNNKSRQLPLIIFRKLTTYRPFFPPETFQIVEHNIAFSIRFLYFRYGILFFLPYFGVKNPLPSICTHLKYFLLLKIKTASITNPQSNLKKNLFFPLTSTLLLEPNEQSRFDNSCIKGCHLANTRRLARSTNAAVRTSN